MARNNNEPAGRSYLVKEYDLELRERKMCNTCSPGAWKTDASLSKTRKSKHHQSKATDLATGYWNTDEHIGTCASVASTCALTPAGASRPVATVRTYLGALGSAIQT